MEIEINERVRLKVSNGLARVIMLRPSTYNSLDHQMLEALVEACQRIDEDPSVSAVILSGAGKAFCSGLDVPSVLKKPLSIVRLLEKKADRPENLVQRAALCWRELSVPVIAITQGYCYGGGFQIALAADFRFSTPDCQFSILESKWGLIPDMGATVLLRELISVDKAKELTMTARVFNGEEALGMNLVTRVCDDPLMEAIDFIDTLREKSPDAVVAAKRLFNEAWLADVPVALKWETVLQKRLLGGWNQLAAVSRHFFKKPLPYRPSK